MVVDYGISLSIPCHVVHISATRCPDALTFVRQDDIIATSLAEIGPTWLKIAERLPGRTYDDARNRWYWCAIIQYKYIK